jgi:hypothetical protein
MLFRQARYHLTGGSFMRKPALDRCCTCDGYPTVQFCFPSFIEGNGNNIYVATGAQIFRNAEKLNKTLPLPHTAQQYLIAWTNEL